MTERQIKQKFREVCKQNNWLVFFPPKTRWCSKDIFLIGDGITVSEKGLWLVQITSLSNLAARRNKILEIKKNTPILNYCPIKIYAYDKKNKEWKVEKF